MFDNGMGTDIMVFDSWILATRL